LPCNCGEDKEKREHPENKLPLEVAPFNVYLQILREHGYTEDADISEAFYTELLTGLEVEGRTLTAEEVMQTPFINLVEAAEKILGNIETEVRSTPTTVPIGGGKIMRGPAAEKYDDDTLNLLAARQLQLHEEEKMRLSAGR